MMEPAPTFSRFLALATVWLAVGNVSAQIPQAASTPPSAEKFRVLFYGQSITAKPWTGKVSERLKSRYPHIDFEFHNPAIGGFQSPNLIRTADHDLYPFYPDLMIFHVYGPWEQYEEIIRRTRQRTTAEIVIQTNHIGVMKDDPMVENPIDENVAKQKAIAEKYGTHVADVASGWRQYLTTHGIPARDLLSDQIHTNARGDDLMADLVFESIKDLRVFAERNRKHKKSIGIDSPEVMKIAGGIELRFEGNRVEALADGIASDVEILLDGKPVRGLKECWAATRPSALGKPFKTHWMPAIKQITFESPPVEETWVLDLLPGSSPDAKRLNFKVTGSRTGADGEGWSDARFVSKSGRVVIEPSDWHIAWALDYGKTALPENYQVTWRTYPLFATHLPAVAKGTHILLAQGFENFKHVLTVRPGTGISGFRVLRPPLTSTAAP